MKPTCPCCGAPIAGDIVPREELVGRLDVKSEVFLKLVQRLAWRPGCFVWMEDLVDYVYRDDEEGGPENAYQAVCNAIYGYRDRLAQLGWFIERRYGRARLITIDKAAADMRSTIGLAASA